MTDKEKAKAYDEAIKRGLDYIRQTPATEMVTRQDVFEAIFPELAESEDEKIRKALIEVFKKKLERGFEWVEYGIPNRSVLDWLEKQKENPKSVDSIPSNCVSNAKCEDRWHKVTDSMPDNPREVLCKDEAGNYFIGRYYVGEGWEISNYDDEDKPHHYNPPVSKWIDFPLEEQKPAKWSEEDEARIERIAAFMWRNRKGDTDDIFLQEQDVAWLKSLRPQPKQEWSEDDEKIYQTVFNHFNSYEKYSCSIGVKKEHILSWLKSLKPSWKPSEEQME